MISQNIFFEKVYYPSYAIFMSFEFDSQVGLKSPSTSCLKGEKSI